MWEWPRGCQARELPETNIFKTRFGHQLLYSDLDACDLAVRDESTRMLVREEWTFMTNSETLHKILNLRCSHHTKHAWSKETHADIYLLKLCRRAVQQTLKIERWDLVQHSLQQATVTEALTAETENASDRDEAILTALPASGIHSSTLVTKLLLRTFWNICKERKQPEIWLKARNEE